MDVQLKERYKKWVKFYRMNPEIYVNDILGISLLPYQKYVVHNFSAADSSFFLASRGSAKSFLTAIIAVAYAMLYPGAKVVVSASVEAQASLLITSKIQNELISLSPYLRYMYQLGLVEFGRTEAGAAQMLFLNNGSSIIGCAPINSSRGLRCSLLILDEIRLMSSQSISAILMPMRTKRIPVYAADTQQGQTAKVVCLTSGGYAYENFYNNFKQHFIRSAAPSQKQRLKYSVMSMDFFFAIQQGVKEWQDYEQLKQNTDKISFEIECLNLIAGQIADGYFDASMFGPSQKNLAGLMRECDDNEFRIIVSDLAFQTSDSNDHTIIIAAALNLITGQKRVDYIQQWEASDSSGWLTRIHQLYDIYNPRLICWDARSGGAILGRQLMSPHAGYSGFNLAPAEYQRINQSTLEDYRSFETDNYAEEVLVPYIASAQSNSEMWLALNSALANYQWTFLRNAADAEQHFMDTGDFFKWTSDEYADKIAPYVQMDELVSEAVNLRATRSNNLLKLSEPRTKTKDRIVTLGMANEILDRAFQASRQMDIQADSWLSEMPVYW